MKAAPNSPPRDRRGTAVKDKSAVQAARLYRTAIHEAGHAIAADQLGLDWHAYAFKRSFKGKLGYNRSNRLSGAWLIRCGKRGSAMHSLGGPIADLAYSVGGLPGGLGGIIKGDYTERLKAMPFFSKHGSPSDWEGALRYKRWPALVPQVAKILLLRVGDVIRLAGMLVELGDVSRWEYYGSPMIPRWERIIRR